VGQGVPTGDLVMSVKKDHLLCLTSQKLFKGGRAEFLSMHRNSLPDSVILKRYGFKCTQCVCLKRYGFKCTQCVYLKRYGFNWAGVLWVLPEPQHSGTQAT
jgi:hypothetical protein